MNTEREMRVLADGCEIIFHSLETAINENKERGMILPGNVPVMRDLMIAYEKCLKSKVLLHELETVEGEGQGEALMRSGNYGRTRYMDGSGYTGEYGRQARGNNGRWMDGQSGGTYSTTYGHDEAMEALRRLADNAKDQSERRVLEDAMNRLQGR